MLSRALKSCRLTPRLSRAYAIRPDIPVLPPNGPLENKEDRYAIPPMLPPDIQTGAKIPDTGKTDPKSEVIKEEAVPFGTQPILLEDQPAPTKPTHRIRNGIAASVLVGALLFAGGLYGSLQNDTISEMFTEFVPYGEEAVLYMQEREFRGRFPQARDHVSKAAPRSSSTNVYIPQSGVMPRVREEPQKHTEAKILQSGPQNSALQSSEKASAGGANDVKQTNKIPSDRQASSETKAGLDKTGKLPDAGGSDAPKPQPIVANELPKKKVPEPITPSMRSTETLQTQSTPVPPPAAPIKTFDIPKPNHKSIEALQFAINGVIKSANEYGSAPFFRDSIENAKDEILAMNQQIAQVQAQEQLRSEEQLTLQAQEFGRLQQQQMHEINTQLSAYEQEMSSNLAQEKQRLNDAYAERLDEEVKRIEGISAQKVQNELLEQAIDLQRKLGREVKSRVEEERGGRLGKLETLQKSIAELKQLNVDSASFIEDKARLQELEIALNALKSILHEAKPRPFLKELATVRDISGSDELLKATIDTIDRESCEAGVPSLGQLGDRFRSVAEEVRKAALLPDDAGVAGHATSWVLSKVMFRKRGMVRGDDVEAVLARAEAYLEANDLDSATREMNSLTGWAHIISSDWLKMARRYLELQQAIGLMESSVVLQALKTQ